MKKLLLILIAVLYSVGVFAGAPTAKEIATKHGAGCTCSNNNQPEEPGFWESLWDATWKTAATDAGGALVGAGVGLIGGPLAPVTSSGGAVTVGLATSATYCIDKIID